MEQRIVEIISHNVYFKGIFHLFFTMDNKPYAIVETENGEVGNYDLTIHKIKFLTGRLNDISK